MAIIKFAFVGFLCILLEAPMSTKISEFAHIAM